MSDFIVVGAGASGCVITRRLIDAGYSVTLIEAGDLRYRDSNIDNVGGFTNLWGSRADWAYKTTPQEGLNNRPITINQGKVVGGSSALNAMMYVRCHHSNYRQLEEAGGSNFAFSASRRVLSRIENYIDGPRLGRYQSGLMKVRNCPDPSSYSPEFQQAAGALGLETDDWDYNGPTQENGAGPLQFNIDEYGHRHSAFNAYLQPILSSNKLTLLDRAEAKKIILDSNGNATSLEIVKSDGSHHTLHSDQKIILSLGAFGSPLLLLRSGIGPDSAFAKSPTKHVLKLEAVGQNLMDHLQLPVIYKLKKSLPNPTLLTGNVAFLNLNDNGLGGAPDLQLNFTPAAPTPLQRFLPPLPGEVMIFLPILVQPKSVGSITIDGRNNPVINPCYLSDSSDLDVLTKSIDFCQQMASSEGLSSLAGDALLPPKEAYVDYIRNNVSTIWHPVGTCRLGNDPNDSVVDSNLQVHGVPNLHICDSSTTPYVTAGNNHVPSLVMAELLSDILLGFS
mgnify:CR=1 FL=1|tara:strand:+ start:1584 stop:3098 length:1515 start_codon:yes stop_codon:yes gene_type:complete